MSKSISDAIRAKAFARRIILEPADRHRGFNTWVRNCAGRKLDETLDDGGMDDARTKD